MSKYVSDCQNGYVFNIDRQVESREYVIVVEGPFDAIAIDGVAILSNNLNKTQIERINALGKKVIVVPDRDAAGAEVLKYALQHNLMVSYPPWDEEIKDVADAVKKYGRIYTLATIIHYAEKNSLKIQILQKKLRNINGK
jgi:DNA primase